MSDGPRAVLVGHAQFASGLLSAVERITGRSQMILPLTNDGMSAEDLVAHLRSHIDANGLSVVFTDLPAGSATLAARRIARERPIVVITGTNLPALLEFVMHSDTDPVTAAHRAVEKGKLALVATDR
jgi:N-acetylgalactosamine PTS system EIIA component